jgi:hypothetical protein
MRFLNKAGVFQAFKFYGKVLDEFPMPVPPRSLNPRHRTKGPTAARTSCWFTRFQPVGLHTDDGESQGGTQGMVTLKTELLIVFLECPLIFLVVSSSPICL